MKANWIRACTLAAVLTISAAFAGAAKADAPDPAVQSVQSFYDVLLDTMKHAKELGIKGRCEKLKPAIEKSFDLQGMIRAAVGLKWNTLSAEEQHALLTAFERKTVAAERRSESRR